MLRSRLVNFHFYVSFYIFKLFKHFKSSINQTTLLFDLNLNYFNQAQAAFDLVFDLEHYVPNELPYFLTSDLPRVYMGDLHPI
jgi:hypothetical protein